MMGNNILNYDYYSTICMFIVIIPNIGGILSIICSEFVAQDVLKLPERHAKMTNHVILALSISDIIFSTSAHIFGTWPVTRWLVYGSSGNKGACTAQGFLIMFYVYFTSLQQDTCTYISPPSPLWMERREAQKVPAFLYFLFCFCWSSYSYLYNYI